MHKILCIRILFTFPVNELTVNDIRFMFNSEHTIVNLSKINKFRDNRSIFTKARAHRQTNQRHTFFNNVGKCSKTRLLVDLHYRTGVDSGYRMKIVL